jgi:WD40 repeat protein
LRTLTSYYEVLGVGPTAEPETLRKAYRRLAQKHHPDVSEDPKAHENMARINEAFETLINAERRQEYDAQLSGNQPEEADVDRRPVRVKLLRRLSGHKTPIYAASYAPDSGQLVTSGFDNELIWWDESGMPVRRTRVDQGAIATLRAFSLDRIAGAGSAENQVWFVRLDEDHLDTFRTSNEEWVGTVAISPDGSRLATGSIYNTVSVIDTDTNTCVFRNADHDGSIMATAWSWDGRYLASGAADARVRIYDGRTGKVVRVLSRIRSAVTALAFSANGKYLAVAGVDLSIRVFDVDSGDLVKMMFGHVKVVEQMAFHPNSWLFASASRDGTVGLWNAAKGIGNVRIEASTRPIQSVAFSFDGTRLAAAGQDKLVRVWEVSARPEA